MKVGGYKNKGGNYSDILDDFDKGEAGDFINQEDEPKEPVEPQEPQESSNPNEGDEPQEPADPSKPTEPQEPAEPRDPKEPTQPQEPTEPQEPVEPQEPKREDKESELTDERVQEYLSEKLGKDVTLEDLKNSKNPLDEDPYLKELYEWRQRTGRPVEDFAKFQKDYEKVDDLDVAREYLQVEYPNSTPEEIELELKKYIPEEEDLDDEARVKKWELKKYATKGRSELNKLKANLDEPSNNLTPELRQKVELADKVQERIDQNQKNQDLYNQGLTKAANSLESLKLDLSDDLSIDFKLSEQDRKELPEMINSMPSWINEDGSPNHEAIAKDGAKIRNFDKILKLAYEQGLNSGKDEIIKESKNTTIDKRDSAESHQASSQKGLKFEDDIDQIIEGSSGKLKMKFGK